jgi:hypothetical protein
MSDTVYKVFSNLTSTNDIFYTIARLFPLAVISIASGIKNSVVILHSFFYLQRKNKTTRILALTGTLRKPTVIHINNPAQTAKQDEILVPTLDYFSSFSDLDSIRSPRSSDLRKMPPNSISK